MQQFRDPKNPRNLPIDLTGVRQIEWENKNTHRETTPTKRPPHDGKTYREKNSHADHGQKN